MPGHESAYTPNHEHPRRFFDFACAYCGRQTHGAVLALVEGSRALRPGYAVMHDRLWMMCSHCGEPSVYDARGRQWPTPEEGPEVEGLPDEVLTAYGEARSALGAGAYTACELVCRKVLMHIAVDVAKAGPGQTFASYIEALTTAGYVTPPMRPWVDRIRLNANEAAHELPQVSRERALSTLMFTAELLRLSYEMGHLVEEFTSDDTDDEAAGA